MADKKNSPIQTQTADRITDPIPLTRIIILALISKKPQITGYGLMQLAEKEFNSRVSFKTGTLYAELRRLEQFGYLTSVQLPTGRKQRKYTITESGEQEVKHLATQISMKIEFILQPLIEIIGIETQARQ